MINVQLILISMDGYQVKRMWEEKTNPIKYL